MDEMETVLVVDDNKNMQYYMEQVLLEDGYRVLFADDGIEALEILSSDEPVALILADIAMPRMNGYQLYEEFIQHPEWVMIPFIFITARAMDSDIRFGKEMGVDDYITKPFTCNDLLAIVRGRLRRAKYLESVVRPATMGLSEREGILSIGELQIDISRHRVWFHGEPVHLSARELKLLITLAQRPDCVVSHNEIVQITHNIDTDYQDAASLLRPLIRSLRRKLGYGAGEMGCIESVRGVGYKFVVSVTEGEQEDGVLYPLRASQY